MIISRTPFRISFFGGGTDYPGWYRQHGGAVLATSINKYCYITARYLPPFFEHRFRVVYSKTETSQTVAEIQHPAVREVLKHLAIDRGVEIHHDGDLPARSGLGSSSAFTVGLLHALHALQGRMPSKHELAREAITVEQDLLHETVGSQDQVAAAYGGLNHVTFARDGEILVAPVVLPAERLTELNSHLMLFYTGIHRIASLVAGSYVPALSQRATQMQRIGEMVEEGKRILCSRQDLSAFGDLLHEGWRAKSSLSSQISTSEIEEWYGIARSAGARGGKIIGAGGGGFMLLFADPVYHQRIRQRLDGLLHVPFRFERAGSQIIFFDPQEDFEVLDAERIMTLAGAGV